MPTMTHQAREARLRRLARRQGLALRKWRSGPAAGCYYVQGGLYYVQDPNRRWLVAGEHGLTLDEAEEVLTAD